MKSSITKHIVVGVIVAAFAAYVIFNNNGGANSISVLQSSPSSIPATGTSSPSTSMASNGAYKDGTYTGTAADAFYGNLQVTAVIHGGKLTRAKA